MVPYLQVNYMLENTSHKFMWLIGAIVTVGLLIGAAKVYFPQTWATVISKNFVTAQPNLFEGSDAQIVLNDDSITDLSANTNSNISSVDPYSDSQYGTVLSLTPSTNSSILATSKKYPVYIHLSLDYQIDGITDIPTSSTIDSFTSPTKRTSNFTSGVGLIVIDAVVNNGDGTYSYPSATAGIGNDKIGQSISGTLDLTKELNLVSGSSLVHVDMYVANIKAKKIVVDNPVVQILDSNTFEAN